MIKFLRGKNISVLAGVEKDLLVENPELFPKSMISFGTIVSVGDIQVTLVSSDGEDSDPISLTAGITLEITDVLMSNIKINSASDTTVNVFTGLESH